MKLGGRCCRKINRVVFRCRNKAREREKKNSLPQIEKRYYKCDRNKNVKQNHNSK